MIPLYFSSLRALAAFREADTLLRKGCFLFFLLTISIYFFREFYFCVYVNVYVVSKGLLNHDLAVCVQNCPAGLINISMVVNVFCWEELGGGYEISNSLT